jgi:uncharacterized protein (TIGR03086 family)
MRSASGFIKTQGAARRTFPVMDITTAETPTTAARYAEALQPLIDVVESVPTDRWTAASPCEGWTARDLVRHLVETQRDFLSGHGVDLGDVPDVDSDPAAAWRQHAQRVVDALADPALPAREYDGHFGPTTIGATLEQFYIFDMVVHRWDIATATGLEAPLTDAELDRIERGADSFGDALYMEGICKPGVEPPAGADRQARVLARLGRRG